MERITFADYHFIKDKDGSIIFDDEISPEQLDVIDGDRFTIEFDNGHIVLRKECVITIDDHRNQNW